jgi:hypothetical protein
MIADVKIFRVTIMDTDNQFRHSPLDLTRSSLRIINLLPQQPDGYIRCTIRHDSLRPNLRFSAVSYEWGINRSQMRRIYVNDQPFEIHHNLFMFLTSLLQHSPNEGYDSLWIDAISLNQQDIEEKNHQVQQMKQIYQAATNTLVWLGPADRDSDLLLDFLSIFDVLDSGKPSFLDLKKLSKRQWTEAQDKILDAGVRMWKACEAFAQREYWSRTWILQELLLSQRPVLFCGSKVCRWHSWAIALDLLGQRLSFTRSWTPMLPESSAFFICQQWFSNLDGLPDDHLVKLVLRFRNSKSSTTHDKVYGLLGLASDASNFPLDYDCEVRDIYNHLLDLLDPHSAIADAQELSRLFCLEQSFDNMRKLLNTASTISEVFKLCRMFPADTGDLHYLPTLPPGGNLSITAPGEAVCISRAEKINLSGIVRSSSRGNLQRLPDQRWEHVYIRWRASTLYPLGQAFVLFNGSINLKSKASCGMLLKCNCSSCDQNALSNAQSPVQFKDLGYFEANDKVQLVEEIRAAIFYREIDGREVYLATGLHLRQDYGKYFLLINDPVVLEETASTPLPRATLAQTINLAIHMLRLSAETDNDHPVSLLI